MRISKHVTVIVLLLLLVTLSNCAQSPPKSSQKQNDPPPPPPASAVNNGALKTVGKASAYFAPLANKTEGTVILDLKVEGMPSTSRELSVMVYFSIPGQGLKKPEAITFNFLSSTSQPKYKDNHHLTIFLDGEQFSTGETRIIKSECDRGRCEEGIKSPAIPFDKFQLMLNAKTITMQLGLSRFEIKGDDLEALRDLSRLVEP